MATTVVIIDDDQDDLEIMGESLRQIDPTILCISFVFPEEAVRLLKKDLIVLPDYIFCDINMPKLTGFDCLKQLREIKELDEVPIVMYSTSMLDNSSDWLLQNGATFTMQKPNKIEDYLTVMECIILDSKVPSKYLRSRTEISVDHAPRSHQ